MQDALWTSAELTQILGAVARGVVSVRGVQTDSRQVVSGDLFIALVGEQSDGHKYVQMAFDKGAAAVIVHQSVSVSEEYQDKIYQVDDSYQALIKLAKAARARVNAKVMAVTGSVGKTSVTQAMRQALQRSHQAHSSIKSYNNHVGVPLSLSRMPSQSEMAVFEVGMSSAGEIAPLSAMIKPDAAIITTVGTAHRENFKSDAEIAAEKLSIIEGIKTDGTLVVGMGHDYDGYLDQEAEKAGLNVIKAGFDEGCDIYPQYLHENHECSCFTVNFQGRLITLKVNQPGREWVMNAMLILAGIDALGGDMVDAAFTLSSLRVEKGRGRLYQLGFDAGEMILQDDSYNANPVSMMAGLKRFTMIPPQKGQTGVVILGDMAELGCDAGIEHDRIMDFVASANFDLVITCGPQMKAAAKRADIEYTACADHREVISAVDRYLGGYERVFVKGSNSMNLGDVVDHLIEKSHRQKKDSPARSQQNAKGEMNIPA